MCAFILTEIFLWTVYHIYWNLLVGLLYLLCSKYDCKIMKYIHQNCACIRMFLIYNLKIGKFELFKFNFYIIISAICYCKLESVLYWSFSKVTESVFFFCCIELHINLVFLSICCSQFVVFYISLSFCIFLRRYETTEVTVKLPLCLSDHIVIKTQGDVEAQQLPACTCDLAQLSVRLIHCSVAAAGPEIGAVLDHNESSPQYHNFHNRCSWKSHICTCYCHLHLCCDWHAAFL